MRTQEAKINIFYLSESPKQAAQWQVDKHVVKMPLESAQMLCTAHRVLDGTETTVLSKTGRKLKAWVLPNKFRNSLLYKAAHVNHPSSVWCRQSRANYKWLYDHFVALSHEYGQRYGKCHKSYQLLRDELYHAPDNIPDGPFTEPTPAMPTEYIVEGDSIASYRNYYTHAKSDLHVWKQNKPDWI